jgi:hypothetical protein
MKRHAQSRQSLRWCVQVTILVLIQNQRPADKMDNLFTLKHLSH